MTDEQKNPKQKSEKPPVMYVVSDSLGDLGATMAAAAASQFSQDAGIVHRLPKVSKLSQVIAYLGTITAQSEGEIALFHTIADAKLRSQLEEYLKDKPVRSVDLIGPAIDAIAAVTGIEPKGEPGLFRKTGEEYFHRVEAMSFAVEHDDGRNAEKLGDADIILIGASRTSKTPLSIYLATFGYNVANIPLAMEIDPPVQLFDVDPRRIFGLTSNARLLSDIRKHRLGNAAGVARAYADPSMVQQDLDSARQLMRRLGCIVVHTDGRSIEETAREVLRYYSLAFPSDKRS
ncbi:MAG TPA: kinase/pyrophosphorylase [Coriobacteriia bacterium]|nr:kinase/pyrophosphorylase [Coriobacteriia bacterium]